MRTYSGLATVLVMSAASPAVVSIVGRDQKGIVARVSTYLADHNVNIENIEQRVMEGLFIMTMLVDLAELEISLDASNGAIFTRSIAGFAAMKRNGLSHSKTSATVFNSTLTMFAAGCDV